MKSRIFAVALVTLALALSTSAENITNPIRYTWIVTSCSNWNCAASAMILANGEPNVMAVPTNNEESPWLVLRRVEEGSVFIPETEPYVCDVYSDVTGAASHYLGMDTCRAPMMLSVPDGRAVVISLGACSGAGGRRRAVRR